MSELGDKLASRDPRATGPEQRGNRTDDPKSLSEAQASFDRMALTFGDRSHRFGGSCRLSSFLASTGTGNLRSTKQRGQAPNLFPAAGNGSLSDPSTPRSSEKAGATIRFSWSVLISRQNNTCKAPV